MDYSAFVGFIRERNRPSGGIRTVHEAALHARLGPGSSVLEIGSNTGFTSVNLSLLTGASVLGIDRNPDSVAEATRYAAAQGASALTRFEQGDATGLTGVTEPFDAIWLSNVASFVADRQKLLAEVMRLLRSGGTLIAVPIYYRARPPSTLLDAVGEAIGNTVEVTDRDYWTRLFTSVGSPGSRDELELYYEADFGYDDHTAEEVEAYCATIADKPHLADLDATRSRAVAERLRHFMMIFADNLSYAGFSIQLYQKRSMSDEVELFTSHRLTG